MVFVRPSHAFAAALMATSLVAVAIPAYADGTSPDPTAVASAIQNGLDPATTTPTPTDSSSAAPADNAAPADSSSSAASSSSEAPAPATSSSAAANPLAGLTDPPASCTAALGGDPTKIQTCITDAIAAAGAPTPPAQLAPVTAFLTCASTASGAVSGKLCVTTLFTALGIPDTTCPDAVLQPVLEALDGLIQNQDPAKLQAVLTGLPTELPAELMKVAACLTPTATTSTPAPTPTPSATASTGTSVSSGAAVSDPTDPVAVAAEPTFTG